MLDGEPRDFLNHLIRPGHKVVYPTGGTSARLVLAVVDKVEPFGQNYVRDGHRGPAKWKIIVKRLREGTTKMVPGGREGYTSWQDSDRPVTITQLHRVVVVDPDAE